MVTCTWCGTNYAAFQPTCDKCGGSLPLPEEKAPASIRRQAQEAGAESPLQVPPPPPRKLPKNYVWRVLSADAGAIAGGILTLVGGIFLVVGLALTLPVITAPVGLPFVGLGFALFAGGGALLLWRYREAVQTEEVLRQGEPVLGRIEDVYQNYNVRINGRSPWVITYRYDLDGREHNGKISTLSRPDLSKQPGRPVYVLYAREEPSRSSIYPHPYGYYGL